MTTLPVDKTLKSPPAAIVLDRPVRAGLSRRPRAAPDVLAISPRSRPTPPRRWTLATVPNATHPAPPAALFRMKPQANLTRFAARPERFSPPFPPARFSQPPASPPRAQLRLSRPVPWLPARPASPAQNLRFHAGIQRLTPGTSSGHPRPNCGTLPGNLRPECATPGGTSRLFGPATAGARQKEQKKGPQKGPKNTEKEPFLIIFRPFSPSRAQQSSVGRASVPATSNAGQKVDNYAE